LAWASVTRRAPLGGKVTPVVLAHLAGGLGKRVVGSEIGRRALQRQRIGARADPRLRAKGAHLRPPPPIAQALLRDADFTVGGVPGEGDFFFAIGTQLRTLGLGLDHGGRLGLDGPLREQRVPEFADWLEGPGLGLVRRATFGQEAVHKVPDFQHSLPKNRFVSK
jgi:hypothetical protein